jgi:hypothetical protein
MVFPYLREEIVEGLTPVVQVSIGGDLGLLRGLWASGRGDDGEQEDGEEDAAVHWVQDKGCGGPESVVRNQEAGVSNPVNCA